MTKHSITVFTKPACVQCISTKKWLDKLGLEYNTIDVSEDDAALKHVKDLGYLTAPVVETADGDHWGGFQPDKLNALAN